MNHTYKIALLCTGLTICSSQVAALSFEDLRPLRFTPVVGMALATETDRLHLFQSNETDLQWKINPLWLAQLGFEASAMDRYKLSIYTQMKLETANSFLAEHRWSPNHQFYSQIGDYNVAISEIFKLDTRFDYQAFSFNFPNGAQSLFSVGLGYRYAWLRATGTDGIVSQTRGSEGDYSDFTFYSPSVNNIYRNQHLEPYIALKAQYNHNDFRFYIDGTASQFASIKARFFDETVSNDYQAHFNLSDHYSLLGGFGYALASGLDLNISYQLQYTPVAKGLLRTFNSGNLIDTENGANAPHFKRIQHALMINLAAMFWM